MSVPLPKNLFLVSTIQFQFLATSRFTGPAFGVRRSVRRGTLRSMQAETSAARPGTDVPLLQDDSAVALTSEYVIFLLVIGAAVTWRAGVFYEGGLDIVVVGKAIVSLVALRLAWQSSARQSMRRVVGNRSGWLLVAYLSCSILGSWAGGSITPTLVLSARVVTLAVTIAMLSKGMDPERQFRALLMATGTFALVAAASGLPGFIRSGRLQGGLPPLKPNELAMLSGLTLLGLMWLILRGEATRRHAVLASVLLTIVWLSGSRTSLAAIVIAGGIMLLQARGLKAGAAFAVLVAICMTTYLALFTDLITGFFERGGTDSVTTLNSRTIAWSAALDYADDSWSYWLGVGIATKKIPVAGQYWQEQLLDSSWMSALVQSGRIGIAVLAVWLATTAIASWRRPQPQKMLLSGLAVFLALRSFLESGLLDGTPAFVALFTVSIAADAASGRVRHVSGR